MKPIEDILYNLVAPLVDDEKNLSVKRLEGLNDKELILAIYAPNDDIARLIGKQGTMAHAIRQVMSIGSRVLSERVIIKFESY